MKFFTFILVFFCTLMSSYFSFPFVECQAEQNEQIALPIIMYHSVHPRRNNAYVISPEKFEDDLIYLRNNNYTTIFMNELINYVEGNGTLPEKPIILSFDDGYYNNYSIVYPLLKQYNFKCVVSLVGEYCDKETKNEGQNDFYSNLSWGEVSELSQTPYFEFQNHSNDMHSLKTIRKGIAKKYYETEEEYKKNLTSDALLCNKKIFEATNKFPNTFCFPFGIFSDLSIEILKECGFKAFLNCEEKMNYIYVGCSLEDLNRYNRPCWRSVEKILTN